MFLEHCCGTTSPESINAAAWLRAWRGFCGVLGTRLIQARPYDPETKGLVERANGYLGSSFLPGRAFCSPADFNAQLLEWLTMANLRKHASTRVISELNEGESTDSASNADR